MCDPVSAGLAIAGMVANTAAQNKVNKAQGKAIDAQMLRNTEYGNQAKQVMDNEAIPNFEIANQQQVLTGAQDKRLSDSEQLAGGGYDLPTAGSSGSSYKSELAKMISDRVAEGRQQAVAATKIGAYGDLGQSNANLMTNSGLKLGTINTNSQNDSAILPYELQGAQSKGDSLRTLGDIFNGAGMIYGMGGFGKPVTAAQFGTNPMSQQTAMIAAQNKGLGGLSGFL
jgi:hypothetical protein